MRHIMVEEDVERMALEMFAEQGFTVLNGLDIAPDGTRPERSSYQDIILIERLRKAINSIPENKHIPEEGREQAIKQILRVSSDKLIVNNHTFHTFVINGISVEYRKDGQIKYDKVEIIHKKVEDNEFLAVNQYTIVENNINRRPDILLFINGIPVVIIELKNPADQQTTIWSAFNQLETYKHQISSLFTFNEICIISDGLEARAGTISSKKERFIAWKTINGKKPKTMMSELELMIKGMLNKETLLDLIQHFIVFEKDREQLTKILAAYHQYNATNKALKSTIKAINSDHRAGIVWHTQGSGKSLTMVFYAGKAVLELNNPTIVVLTDRNDLDDQLFETFAKCYELLRQKPEHAERRDKLKELLNVSSGGVVFTTIQKFFPEDGKETYPLLSERKNIIVIADEAHRTQYGFKAKVVVTKAEEAIVKYGFAKYVRDALPNASFIGFSGTPIETKDRSTPAVFGNYVDVYDIEQAVDDHVTVRIYYESRLAKLELKPEERPHVDPEFEEVTEQEESDLKEKLKSKWARLEKVVGSEARIKKIAQDVVDHFEKRSEVLEGKGMIVCMSRRICVELYNEIIKLRPGWHNEDDDKGAIKVIMTGSATDKVAWQKHIRNKPRRRAIGDRMKDPADPLKIVIVRDMWLTGFDVPCLHSMYVDKPMQAHGLMQAIARVNRVFKDKEGGLIVDYIGIARELKNAVSNYTASGGSGKPTVDQDEAVALMLEKFEIVTEMMHGYNYKKFFTLSAKEKMVMIPNAIEFILKQKNGKERYLQNVTGLIGAFSLAVPHPKALKIKDEVGLFQAIRAAIVKNTATAEKDTEQLDTAIRQIISKAIISDRVVDIFAAAGLKKPNIAILSDEFLEDVKELPQKNLAFEMLKKLLNDEIRIKMKKNLVQGRSFLEMLEKSIRAYTNKNIETAQVIQELIDLAKNMREANKRGEELNLTEDEIAFYDALEVNDSAVKVLGDKTLKAIAKELVETVRNNVSIDWTLRENVQAKLRVMVKRVLKKYGYPPDKQVKATDLVLEQAAIIAKDWAEVST